MLDTDKAVVVASTLTAAAALLVSSQSTTLTHVNCGTLASDAL
jgi:hypothetical protein